MRELLYHTPRIDEHPAAHRFMVAYSETVRFIAYADKGSQFDTAGNFSEDLILFPIRPFCDADNRDAELIRAQSRVCRVHLSCSAVDKDKLRERPPSGSRPVPKAAAENFLEHGDVVCAVHGLDPEFSILAFVRLSIREYD